MIYIGFFIILMLSNLLFFAIGRRIGAKEGIDYCFEQKEKELLH